MFTDSHEFGFIYWYCEIKCLANNPHELIFVFILGDRGRSCIYSTVIQIHETTDKACEQSVYTIGLNTKPARRYKFTRITNEIRVTKRLEDNKLPV